MSCWPRPRSAAFWPTIRYPADFIRDNLDIQTNVIEASCNDWREAAAVPGLVVHLSEAVSAADQEEYLLTGPLEPTNRPYALAKIAGIEMCWSYNRQYGTRYLAAMPTNLYGPDDNFDLTNVACAAGADSRKAADREGVRREHEIDGMGNGNAAARVSLLRRCWPEACCVPDGT